MYYAMVKPLNDRKGNNYLFKCDNPLDIGELVKCNTRYGDMYGKVEAVCWCGQSNVEDMESLLKSAIGLNEDIKTVKAYYRETIIESEDE